MKKSARLISLLTLVLLLAQVACAEPDEAVKGIFDALVAENSSYSQTRAMYAAYYPGAVCEETSEDDGFTIAVSGSEYMDGSWTFKRNGDYLTVTLDEADFSGISMALNVIQAVGAYYGTNKSLISSYVNGLSALDIESENFKMSRDEAAGTTTLSIRISGPWDMKELDQMVFDETSLALYEPLGADSSSMGGSIGRMMMIANGSASDLTLLVGEYGGLDELAYRSIVYIVNVLQPDGWEDFAAGYTGLAEVDAEGYSVRLNVDMATVGEIIDDASEDYGYALIRFGSSEEETRDDYEPPVPAEAPTAEELTEGYFAVIAGLETDSAGMALKTATAASEVCRFAEAHALYDPDEESLRANMRAAFEAMGEDGQARFREGFEAVRALLDDSLEDYDANRVVFEDAGVTEAMDEVMYDPLNRLAWENLRDQTLSMGSDVSNADLS